jgi:hypothetical protein
VAKRNTLSGHLINTPASHVSAVAKKRLSSTNKLYCLGAGSNIGTVYYLVAESSTRDGRETNHRRMSGTEAGRLTTHSTGARIAWLSSARLSSIGGSSRRVNSSVRPPSRSAAYEKATE